MYEIGDQLILHVYKPAAHPQVVRSAADRRKLQEVAPIAGIPKLLFAHEDGELYWMLEQRLCGVSGTSLAPESLLPGAIEWLCRLAQIKGPPLRDTPFWASHFTEALESSPPGLRPAIAAAWDRIGDVQSAPLHGDVQPKNLILGEHGVGLVDWEGMWLHGLPGLDVLFLATMSGDEAPARIVPELLADPPGSGDHPLRMALGRCGYQQDTINSALLATLSIWNLGEMRRLRRNPSIVRRTPFSEMLAQALPNPG